VYSFDRFQGNWSLPEDLPVSEGNEYEFEGLRHRDPDGERAYFEVRPTTAVERLNGGADSTGDDGDDDDPQPTDATDGDSGATAAADGGTDAEIVNTAPQVVSAARRLDESGDYPDGVPPEAIKEAVDAPAEAVEHGIEKATKDGTLYQPTEGHYRPT